MYVLLFRHVILMQKGVPHSLPVTEWDLVTISLQVLPGTRRRGNIAVEFERSPGNSAQPQRPERRIGPHGEFGALILAEKASIDHRRVIPQVAVAKDLDRAHLPFWI